MLMMATLPTPCLRVHSWFLATKLKNEQLSARWHNVLQKIYIQIHKKDTRPAVLLAGDILEDCKARVFLSQWETVIDCFGPTLANIRTIMAMIDDYTEEWAVLYIHSSDFHFGRIWVGWCYFSDIKINVINPTVELSMKMILKKKILRWW